MNSLSLIREIGTDKQTVGQLIVISPDYQVLFKCFTLELPWRGNQRNISCIPEGRYKAVKRTSEKYGKHLHILGVKDRSLILIHEANYVRELRGCIAVGKYRLDIDGDGLDDVKNSLLTKKELLGYLPDETEIAIHS